jgi:hypothetical protein
MVYSPHFINKKLNPRMRGRKIRRNDFLKGRFFKKDWRGWSLLPFREEE